MKEKYIQSMREFKQTYFPKIVKREEQKELESDPKLFGEHLAKQFISGLEAELNN
jgi:hypothetical protein